MRHREDAENSFDTAGERLLTEILETFPPRAS